MLQPKRTATARITWADRDARTARTTLYALSNTPYSVFQDAVLSWIDRARLVSNAKIRKVEYVYEYYENDLSEPNALADCSLFVALYYGKEDNTGVEALYIPSPVAELFETSGPFAGIRTDAQAVQMQGLITLFEDAPNGIVTIDGDPWPTSFIVGGLVL
jgi:hypothetical protein